MHRELKFITRSLILCYLHPTANSPRTHWPIKVSHISWFPDFLSSLSHMCLCSYWLLAFTRNPWSFTPSWRNHTQMTPLRSVVGMAVSMKMLQKTMRTFQMHQQPWSSSHFPRVSYKDFLEGACVVHPFPPFLLPPSLRPPPTWVAGNRRLGKIPPTSSRYESVSLNNRRDGRWANFHCVLTVEI